MTEHNCNVSQCKISYHCANVHSTYKPPCASINGDDQCKQCYDDGYSSGVRESVSDIRNKQHNLTLTMIDTKVVEKLSEIQSSAMGQPLSKYEQHYVRACEDIRRSIASLIVNEKSVVVDNDHS
ncbi:MAG: hypothetical protein EHM34_06215 [Nitrosopumilales archaeon]|nr:MAG: hypothetical protein EHM34_06215 [Nitrosopumilales archaeon]